MSKMQVIKVEQGSEEWRAFREEKISGTKLGKLFAKSRKTGELFDTTKPNLQFYEILAERLSVGAQDGIEEVSAMERGHLLEGEAVEIATKKLGLKNVVRDNVWQDGTNPNFICSPDAYTEDLKTAIEVKCLSSANHIKAIVEDQYPKDYQSQIVNYFLVNPDLKVLYFVMYDPRFFNEELQMKIFKLNRKDFSYDIERMRDVRAEADRQINSIVERFTF